MGTYRKTYKQEAYEAALYLAAQIPDNEELNDYYDAIIDEIQAAHNLMPADAKQVVAKAIRVERGRRVRGPVIKKSFDLSEADCGMLAELQAELGHSTEVTTIRAAIHKLYAETFA